MTKKNATDSSMKYVRMQSDSEFSDLQWKTIEKPKIPYRSIIVAIILLVMGTVLLTVGVLLFTNTYFSVKYHDRTWPVIVIGCILFIPGFYHVRLAYYAYKGYKGYKFDDIPDYDE
ncbi:transmembrane protein 230-like [Anneissia japonica]|uniref:transmembrane protein 230-like n=1 Tax=Anneissia japonica TaxID=1529436 RepID=UPI0014259B8F|nr:transmembrane protein 230-like [Anneissia japonica]